jgi:hypothetical protein
MQEGSGIVGNIPPPVAPPPPPHVPEFIYDEGLVLTPQQVLNARTVLGISGDFSGNIRHYRYSASEGQTTFSGIDLNGATLSYVVGVLEVSVNGSWLTSADYTATNGTSVVFPTGLPAGSTVYVQTFTPFDITDTLIRSQNGADVLDKSAFRANLNITKKNYIVNGAMMVSQENGTNVGSISGYYPVDQFLYLHSSDATVGIAQVLSTTPAGSPNRLRISVNVADASIASSQFALIRHPIEGLRTSDLRWGSGAAKTVTLQFGVRAPAGTYAVRFTNGNQDRFYVSEYTISPSEANTDVVKSVVVPGDIIGTWSNNTSIGIMVDWVLVVGSLYFTTTPNVWQAPQVSGTSNQFNFLGTVNNTFELFDVGLYEGTSAPPFQVPDYASELMLCKRYWERYAILNTIDAASLFTGIQIPWPVQKRVTPTLTYTDQVGNVGKITNSGTHNLVPTGGGISVDQNSFGFNMTVPSASPNFWCLAIITGNARM